MSISEKQLKANRENAKKGGVKTKDGKFKSRLNAVKHGMLLSSQMIIPGEDVEELASFQEAVRFELLPYGELELILVDRFISSAWRLRRAISMERTHILNHYPKIINKNPKLLLMDKLQAESAFINGSYVDIILRYETTIERQMFRALDKLIELRKIRDNLEKTPGATSIDRRLPLTQEKILSELFGEDTED